MSQQTVLHDVLKLRCLENSINPNSPNDSRLILSRILDRGMNGFYKTTPTSTTKVSLERA